ncbi:MAG: hypothetical protein L0I33_01300, partial [Acetobacter sp.]|nr:hypothetical protein [Acetobacter sp.]
FCKACTPIVRVLVFCKNSQKTKKNKILLFKLEFSYFQFFFKNRHGFYLAAQTGQPHSWG